MSIDQPDPAHPPLPRPRRRWKRLVVILIVYQVLAWAASPGLWTPEAADAPLPVDPPEYVELFRVLREPGASDPSELSALRDTFAKPLAREAEAPAAIPPAATPSGGLAPETAAPEDWPEDPAELWQWYQRATTPEGRIEALYRLASGAEKAKRADLLQTAMATATLTARATDDPDLVKKTIYAWRLMNDKDATLAFALMRLEAEAQYARVDAGIRLPPAPLSDFEDGRQYEFSEFYRQRQRRGSFTGIWSEYAQTLTTRGAPRAAREALRRALATLAAHPEAEPVRSLGMMSIRGSRHDLHLRLANDYFDQGRFFDAFTHYAAAAKYPYRSGCGNCDLSHHWHLRFRVAWSCLRAGPLAIAWNALRHPLILYNLLIPDILWVLIPPLFTLFLFIWIGKRLFSRRGPAVDHQ